MSNIQLTKLANLIKSFFAHFNMRKWGVIQEAYFISKFDAPFSISYAQGAEDLVFLNLIKNKSKGFYIDIGAHDPNRFSVTRRLYHLGWRGINVDANSEIESKFRYFRPKDIFISAAVGSTSNYTFHKFQESAINTSSEDWKYRFAKEGNTLIESINVIGISLFEIFSLVQENVEIDLLNIDIEGSDFEALQSAKFDNLPKQKLPNWIILETPLSVREVLSFPAIMYLQNFGYEIICVLPMSTILKKIASRGDRI